MGCLREKYLIKPVSKQSVVPSYSFFRASEPGKEELCQDLQELRPAVSSNT